MYLSSITQECERLIADVSITIGVFVGLVGWFLSTSDSFLS